MGYASFFFLILLAFQPSPSISENTEEGLIPVEDSVIFATCKKTKYYHQCASYLTSSPRTPKADGAKGLAMTMSRIGKMNATDTASYLSSQILKTTKNQVDLKNALQVCKDKYTLANEYLNSSLEDLPWGIYDSSYSEVRTAKHLASDCRKEFKKSKGLVYPREIARREVGFTQVCDIGLEIIQSIVKA